MLPRGVTLRRRLGHQRRQLCQTGRVLPLPMQGRPNATDPRSRKVVIPSQNRWFLQLIHLYYIMDANGFTNQIEKYIKFRE